MGALIADTTSDVILDVGGDDLGARAVGYYSDIIKNRSHTIFFVMNSYRPFTSTLQSALKIYDEVEASAGLKINGIINNSNLLEDTCADTVTGGLELIKQVSDARNVPILIHTAMNRLLPELEKIFPGDMLLGMDEYVKLLFSRKS